ncbi:hypothetical protein HK098_005228, partial [Nowakowskiella sp. JEL0407]
MLTTAAVYNLDGLIQTVKDSNTPDCFYYIILSASSLSLCVDVFLNPINSANRIVYSKKWENKDLNDIIPQRYSNSTEYGAVIQRCMEKGDLSIQKKKDEDIVKVNFPGVIEFSVPKIEDDTAEKKVEDLVSVYYVLRFE